MSRPATTQLSLRFVLRTLARLRVMTRLDQAALAKELMLENPLRLQVGGLADYLDGVASEMRKLGFDPNRHPNPVCAECGGSNMCDHNGARYCSDRCRQRAYRKRLNSKRGRMKRNETAICDASFSADDNSNVTPSVGMMP